MLNVEVYLRKVDGSVRNEDTYYLVEIRMMGQTTKVAQIYDIDLAREFADIVVLKFQGNAVINDKTEEE